MGRYVHISQSGINSIAYSSIFNIGDTVNFNPKFRAIAMQREGNVWNDNYDLQFNYYSIFEREAKWLESSLPIETNYHHHDNNIIIGNISITGVSQSSSVQFGGLKNINAETRLKHIRLIQERET
jgi:spore germination protein PE